MQITKNSDEGSFSSCYFSVAKYAPVRKSNDLGQLVGLDLDWKDLKVEGVNNDGFLRAVLRHLLDGGASA